MVSIASRCALLPAMLSALLIAPPASAGINWIQGTWEDALLKAGLTHRPIMALFSNRSCEACIAFDSMLADSGIVAISAGSVCVRFDKDGPVGKATADRFMVLGPPVTIFFDSKGREIDRVLGATPPKVFLAEMQRIRSGKGTVSDLLAQESSHREDLEFNFLLGSKLSQRGDPRARQFLERVLALDSTNASGKTDNALFELARTARLEGDTARWVASLERLLRSFPNSEMALPAQAGVDNLRRGLYQNQRPDTTERAASLDTMVVTVKSAKGRHAFHVEVARTPKEQSRGLSFRKDLAKDGGMIFTPYPVDGGPPREASFWMKDTPIALDIIFIRADGTIARVARNAAPLSVNPILSGEPVAAVLEILGGRAAELGIAEGDQVSWPKP